MGTANWEAVDRRSRAFDALGVPAALLDGRGVIIDVNGAWRLATDLDPGPLGQAVQGVDYARVLGGLPPGSGAAELVRGLRAVLVGERRVAEVELACSSSLGDRWLRVRVASADRSPGHGAVVSHTDITEQRVLQEQVGRLGDHVDTRTGLPDGSAARSEVSARLAGAWLRQERVAITLIDVLEVEEVAEAIDRPAVDQLMAQVTARVRHSVRRDDVLCRTGDATLALVATLGIGDDPSALAERLASVLSQPFQVGAAEISLPVAVCQVVSGPGDDEEDLLAELEERRRGAWERPHGDALVRQPELWSSVASRRPADLDPVVSERTALLDAVGEALLVLDPDGRAFFLNRAAEEVHGWKADDAEGRSLPELGVRDRPAEEVERLLAQVVEGEAWSGEMVLTRRDGRRFPAQVSVSPLREAGEVVAIVWSTIDITEQVEAEAEAHHHLRHDALTGLRNRADLVEVLDRELEEAGATASVTALLVDLDEFRAHNEAFGLPIGDALLKGCADALRRVAHDGDAIARFSGNTFAIGCPHLGGGDAPFHYGENVRAAVAQPLPVAGVEVSLASSVGVATSGLDATDADGLLRRAEAAMTAAKENGRRQTVVYDEKMRERLARALALDHQVRQAVATGEVSLAFQAVTRLDDQVVVGAEALLRMTGPDGRPLPPLDLLDAADRCGLGPAFGTLVLRSACEEAFRWQRLLPERPLVVSVNVTASQFADPDLPERVRAVLDEAGLDPSRLGLEISETVLMDDVEHTARQLARLRMLGVRLSADDFGTGYSSLASLKRFPLDAIKADISFVAGVPDSPEDVAILSAMLGVARALNLLVVAEGVEDERQLTALRELGCSLGQGYYWSRAVDGPSFLELADAPWATEPAGPHPDGAVLGQRDPGDETVPAGDGISERERSDVDIAFRALAHELRTPLTVVMGFASLLEAVLEGEDRTSAEAIRRASERMNRLISGLEDVRSLDQGSLRLELDEVDPVAYVAELVAELAAVGGHPLAFRAAPDLDLRVTLDRVRVSQVITNLVSNASKFSPPGTPIEVVVGSEADAVVVEVLDRGPGIPSDELGLIWRKYARLDRSRSGTGLGLYLARGIARAHGGDLTYRHRPGGGSIFALRLPR